MQRYISEAKTANVRRDFAPRLAVLACATRQSMNIELILKYSLG